ncbi:MAG: acyl-homoserine-lactone synthase [Patescibacteria group bacterium]
MIVNSQENKSEIFIREQDLVARNFNEPALLDQAYKLRQEVFTKRLKWVGQEDAQHEKDTYDEHSIVFGVFRNETLLGMVRIIDKPEHFMMHKDFLHLVHEKHSIRTENDTIELSRLVVDPSIQKTSLGNLVARLLYKSVYQWSIANKKRYWYFASTERFVTSLKKRFGLVVEITGELHKDHRGEKYHGAFIDLRELERSLNSWDPRKYIAFRWLLKK